MQLVKNSSLAVFALLFAFVYAAPDGSATIANEPSAAPAEKDAETTILPTRPPNAPSQPPALIHSSPPPAEEKTTKTAPAMQSATEKSDQSTSKPEDQKGSAISHNQVYPLVFSTAVVVLFSSYSLV